MEQWNSAEQHSLGSLDHACYIGEVLSRYIALMCILDCYKPTELILLAGLKLSLTRAWSATG